VLRAKVALRVVDAMRAFVAFDSTAVADLAPVPGTQMIMLGGDGQICLALPGEPSRWLLLRMAANPQAADASADAHNRVMLADIDRELVSLPPLLEEKLLPQWLGLDTLDAISVRKGCYPGQEVVARLHFKGGIKRSLYRLDFHSTALPEAGAEVRSIDTGDDSGILINAAWREPGLATALAVLHDDTVDLRGALLTGSSRVEAIWRAASGATKSRLP